MLILLNLSCVTIMATNNNANNNNESDYDQIVASLISNPAIN